MKLFKEQLFYENSAIRSLHLKLDSFDFAWHYHEDYEISLCLKGSGLRYTGDTIENYQSPELLFVPPGLPHTWQSELHGDNEAYIIQFNKDFFGLPFEDIPDMKLIIELLNEPRSLVSTLTTNAIVEVERLHNAKGAQRLAHLLLLLHEIANSEKSFGNTVSPDSLDKSLGQKLDLVVNHIKENWNEDINVPDLAKQCAMSQSTFRRFIKKTTGYSFVNFVNLLKISKSCEYLTDNSLTITEVSSYAGFNSLSFFNRKFKEIKKISPSQFRKEHFRN